MNILLIQDGAILGVDPEVTPDAYVFPDAIIPRHVCPDALLLSVEALPADYQPGSYTWADNALVPVAPAPAPAPAVPQSVTMRQAVLALLDADLLDDIETLVSSLPRRYQLEWQRASDVSRDNALVEIVRQTKDMTVQQIDDLFIAAATL